jgi:hypothetical protein
VGTGLAEYPFAIATDEMNAPPVPLAISKRLWVCIILAGRSNLRFAQSLLNFSKTVYDASRMCFLNG